MKTTGRLSTLGAAAKAAASLKCHAWPRRPASLVLLAGTLLLCAMPKPVLGTLFVTGPFNNGTIGEYTDSGATVNASLITGLSDPQSIAVSGGFLYVTNPRAGTVGKYTTSGQTINAALISGLNFPQGVEVSGGDLYVSDFENSLTGIGRVGKYTASGAPVNASLITGLLFPNALAVSGTKLFVSDGGRIGEYTTSGSTVNASLITVEQGAHGVEASGSSLFISYYFGDDPLVGKWNIDGTAINPRLIIHSTGIVEGIAVSGTDLFVTGGGVSKYTTSGMIVADPLPNANLQLPTAIAVEGPATVPETLSTLWLGLTAGGLLGFERLLRAHQRRSPECYIKKVAGNK